MTNDYDTGGQVAAQLDYSARWHDLRADHEADLREAVTGLAARPGTRNGRVSR